MAPRAYAEVTGLLLAGGRSTRFGRDKALARLDGGPLIRRVYDAVSAVTSRVLVSFRDAHQRYPTALPPETLYVEDATPEAGPLAGLAAGCATATTPWVLVVACDLPHLTHGVLTQLLDARSYSATAVIARTPDGRTHPHCAVYRRAAAAQAVGLLLASNNGAFHAVLDRLNTRMVEVPARYLHNVNRPEDLV